jgi:hypothetical protein
VVALLLGSIGLVNSEASMKGRTMMNPTPASKATRRRRRLLYAIPILLSLLGPLLVASTSQANPPEDSGLFELDKNVQDDVSTTFLGSLGGNINATATSFTVCQASNTNPSTPITIQVDAEQMTVGAIASAGGGGCTGAFKRTYSSVVRGANGTTAASHGASGVSGFVTQVVAGPVAGDDWDQVYDAVAANGSPSESTPNPCSGAAWTGGSDITACDWVHDPEGETIFVQGGSKDDLDIPSWRHSDGSVPDADDITDAFVAKYVDPDDEHQYLFFGADRTAVNGAKDMGFWFFKSPVSLNPDGTFSGVHTVGDILLLATFTQGGAETTIRVFEWVGPGQGDTNDVLDSGGQFDDCVGDGNTNGGCSTVNNTTVQSSWAYQSKISGSPADTLYAGALLEGGIDLTTLGLEGCFSNFLAETRSSPEIGAQLKDFVLGSFEVCDSSLTTTPADGAGTALTDSDDDDLLPEVTIGTGSAGVDVTDSADLTVEGTDTWSGTLRTFLCGPIATGTCETGGLEIGSGTAVDQDTVMPVTSGTANLTSVGRYCWRGLFESETEGVNDSTDSSEGECFEVLPVQPLLSTMAGDDVILGSAITDNATLTGTAYQPGDDGPDTSYPSINATMDTAANGTITFTLVGPDDCTSEPTGFVPIDVTVNGDSSATNLYTASFTPSQIGKFTWIAEYSGDSPNTLGAGPTSCPDANEEVVVTGTAAFTTAQRWLPNDTATITGDTNLNGTLTFQLYTGSDCDATGTAVEGQDYSFTLTDEPSPATRSTLNGSDPADTFVVTDANQGAYSWLVTYDDTRLDVEETERCETSSLTIADEPPEP